MSKHKKKYETFPNIYTGAIKILGKNSIFTAGHIEYTIYYMICLYIYQWNGNYYKRINFFSIALFLSIIYGASSLFVIEDLLWRTRLLNFRGYAGILENVGWYATIICQCDVLSRARTCEGKPDADRKLLWLLIRRTVRLSAVMRVHLR